MLRPNNFTNLIEDQKFKIKESDINVRDFLNDVLPPCSNHWANLKKSMLNDKK